jgi:hypothetical protein
MPAEQQFGENSQSSISGGDANEFNMNLLQARIKQLEAESARLLAKAEEQERL